LRLEGAGLLLTDGSHKQSTLQKPKAFCPGYIQMIQMAEKDEMTTKTYALSVLSYTTWISKKKLRFRAMFLASVPVISQ
jgi:hypothetical protein